MRTTKSTTAGFGGPLLGICLALVVASDAMGQTASENETSRSDEWRFTLAPLYIWFAGVEGDAGLGPVNGPLSVTFSDVLDNLDGVFTFHFEAGKGKWNIIADGLYLDLKPQATLPNGVPVNISSKTTIGELAGTYRVRDAAPWVEVIGGVRYTDLSVSGLPFPPGPGAPPSEVEESWLDGFGGVRLGHAFGEKKQWSVWGRADAGAGGSDLTWSALMLAGWQFTEWGSLNAGYKWLGYDYETGSGASRFTWDVTYEGPIAGLAFHW